MDEKTILDFLREVRHPGQGDRNIVELGMVNSIDDEGGKVTVTLGFPKRRDPLPQEKGPAHRIPRRGHPRGTHQEPARRHRDRGEGRRERGGAGEEASEYQ